MAEGYEYLKENRVSGDELKCYLLAYSLLAQHGISDIIDLVHMKALISERIMDAICKDVSKYGVEYEPVPSDFFPGIYQEFVCADMMPWIQAEKDILRSLQMEDGGFDISWQWYTPYSEFEQARQIWRPRITIDKILFYETEFQ